MERSGVEWNWQCTALHWTAMQCNVMQYNATQCNVISCHVMYFMYTYIYTYNKEIRKHINTYIPTSTSTPTCYISMLHVHVTYTCYIYILHVLLHIHATYTRYIYIYMLHTHLHEKVTQLSIITSLWVVCVCLRSSSIGVSASTSGRFGVGVVQCIPVLKHLYGGFLKWGYPQMDGL